MKQVPELKNSEFTLLLNALFWREKSYEAAAREARTEKAHARYIKAGAANKSLLEKLMLSDD